MFDMLLCPEVHFAFGYCFSSLGLIFKIWVDFLDCCSPDHSQGMLLFQHESFFTEIRGESCGFFI